MPHTVPSRSTSQSWWDHVREVCSPEVQQKMEALDPKTFSRIEEIRFRVGQPLQICGVGLNHFLHCSSGLTQLVSEGWLVTQEHIGRVLQTVTQSSMYAVEEELRRGFVTMPGGHRVGIAGRAVMNESGTVRTVRDIVSVNVRIAREYIGASMPLHRHVLHSVTHRPLNVLIISPPQCGKTTLLRDLARTLSEGDSQLIDGGFKVSIVDERSEIAGCVNGVAQFRLGPRTDILDACPKAEGMLMAIRSLSPDVVATDEIGRFEDRDAILDATHAGVGVLATAHANTFEEWRMRPAMQELYNAKAFKRYVILSRKRGPGTIESILDASGVPIANVNPAPGRSPHA